MVNLVEEDLELDMRVDLVAVLDGIHQQRDVLFIVLILSNQGWYKICELKHE